MTQNKWLAILIPVLLGFIGAAGLANYTRTLQNEHRLSTVESGVTAHTSTLDKIVQHEDRVDVQLNHMSESLGRIEGTLGTNLPKKPGQ